MPKKGYQSVTMKEASAVMLQEAATVNNMGISEFVEISTRFIDLYQGDFDNYVQKYKEAS